jgi:hypothetical protein
VVPNETVFPTNENILKRPLDSIPPLRAALFDGRERCRS